MVDSALITGLYTKRVKSASAKHTLEFCTRQRYLRSTEITAARGYQKKPDGPTKFGRGTPPNATTMPHTALPPRLGSDKSPKRPFLQRKAYYDTRSGSGLSCR